MTKDQESATSQLGPPGFDTGSHEDFYEYYKKQSLSPQTMQRFGAVAEIVLRVREATPGFPLDVLDVGCGAGALAVAAVVTLDSVIHHRARWYE